MIKLLAICGSLRAASANNTLLRAAVEIAPVDIDVSIFAGLGELPHFNPDLDTDPPLEPVRALRAAIGEADGLLICSPEYAHGVPGVLKNALDWLVSGVEIMHKPVALLNASPRATHAQASLKETLTTMAARVLPDASLTVPISGRDLDVSGILGDPALAGTLRWALVALAAAVVGTRDETLAR